MNNLQKDWQQVGNNNKNNGKWSGQRWDLQSTCVHFTLLIKLMFVQKLIIQWKRLICQKKEMSKVVIKSVLRPSEIFEKLLYTALVLWSFLNKSYNRDFGQLPDIQNTIF